MLNILLMIILLIIILIFIILLFGIRLHVKWLKIDNEYDGCIKILIFKRLTVYTYNLESDDDDDDFDEEDRERDFKKLRELAKPCLGDLKEYLHDVLDAVSINRIENHLVIGFSNFAKTGEYIGYIWAIFSIAMGILPNTRLSAEPSFKGEVLNLKGHLNIDISILKLVIPTARLLLKRHVRALIRGVLDG
ncbi:DUF2953 domain-containing protein [Methanobrevibacter sp.]|uniref:DUF2953 domain-containing protein n=1 Tax=Methanobrevibacter sp. TaxID=66852 RepID=UPI003890E374